MSPRQEIADLDRQITANRRGSNDKGKEAALFYLRGIAQLRRDEADEELALRIARRPLRKSSCPTCGHATYA